MLYYIIFELHERYNDIQLLQSILIFDEWRTLDQK